MAWARIANPRQRGQARWDAVHGKGDKDFLCRNAQCDANLDAIANDLDFSMQISLAFWQAVDANDMATVINDNAIKDITQAVNGGQIAIDKRIQYTKKAYEVFK
jgi:predicted chitinase